MPGVDAHPTRRPTRSDGDVPAVEVVDLHRRYGSFEAVRGISFEVRPGEVFALLGVNGAGKTSALEASRDWPLLRAGPFGSSEVAARAHLSPGTVRNHLSAAAAKLGTPNRHAAVAEARRHGWI